MATIKIDPLLLKAFTYVGKDTYLVFDLAPNRPAYLKAAGTDCAVVAQATCKTDAPVCVAVKLVDLLTVVKAANIYTLDVTPKELTISSDGMTARFPTSAVPSMVSWADADDPTVLPQEFIQAVSTFAGIADSRGNFMAAFFVKDGYLTVTDKVQYVRAKVGSVGEMVLTPFDPRLLQGMSSYFVLDNKVVFQGKNIQLHVAKSAADHPPVLSPSDGVGIELTKELLAAAPSDTITLYTDKGMLKLEGSGTFELTAEIVAHEAPLYVQFDRRGLIEGLLPGGKADIATLGGIKVFRVQTDNCVYLLAEKTI